MAGERLQRDSAALFRHNPGVLKEAEQPDAPSVEERLQAALASLEKREEKPQEAPASPEKHEEMPKQEMLTSSLSNGYQEPVLAVHEARAEFTAQKAEPPIAQEAGCSWRTGGSRCTVSVVFGDAGTKAFSSESGRSCTCVFCALIGRVSASVSALNMAR